MDEPPDLKDATFHVVHNDGVVYCVIRGDRAILVVYKIRDVEVLIQAINRAASYGVTHGTMFTGDNVNLSVGAKSVKRSDRGTTWLGGKVTRLADSPDGYSQFRIDWDEFPTITV